jgi:hypothetical protein
VAERTPWQSLGDSIADKAIEAIEGFPGTNAQKAEAAGIVVMTLNDYQVQKEDEDRIT